MQRADLPDVADFAAVQAKKRRFLLALLGNLILLVVMVGGPWLRGYLRARESWRQFGRFTACLYGGTPSPEPGLGLPRGSEAHFAARVFEPSRWNADEPVKVVLIGTDFEVKVWETLLKIPVGRATTYQSVAEHIGKPSASRAVGAAVGKNPISFVVPCHRVVGSTGALTGYHWGVPRKRAILGWEAGVIAA